MASVRTIKYLVVDNVVEEVPDAAPEIDIEVSGPADIAAALLRTTHLPPSADIYIQTQRPDGSLRWQPLNAVADLPQDSLLVAKLVRPKGGAAVARPQGGPRPTAIPQPQQQQQQHHSLLGKLLGKVTGGGGTGQTTSHYAGRPHGGGPMMMGGAGMGAMGAAGAGFGRIPGGATDAEEAAWEQQVAEQAALDQLEDDAMRQDVDGDGIDDNLQQGDDQAAYDNFEAAAGDFAEQREAGGDDNDFGGEEAGGQADGFGGGDVDGAGGDFGGDDDGGGFDNDDGGDFGGGDDE